MSTSDPALEDYRRLAGELLFAHRNATPTRPVLSIHCQQCGPKREVGRVLPFDPWPLFVAQVITRGPWSDGRKDDPTILGVLLGHSLRRPQLRTMVECPVHGLAEVDPSMLSRKVQAGERRVRVRCGSVTSAVLALRPTR